MTCKKCESHNVNLLDCQEVGCGGLLYRYECEDCGYQFEENYH
jgi:transcriptional regulator NrdR family protein